MILLAPAKSLNDIDINLKQSKEIKLSLENYDKVKYLVNSIKKLSKEDMAKVFKIKNDVLNKTYFYYTKHEQNNSLEAILLYNGISYKQLSINTLKVINDLEYEYLQNNVYIISTLYGLVNSVDKIKPYRLDFSNSKIIEGSLYNYWSTVVNQNILKIKPRSILNLASQEYSKILNKDTKDKFTVYNIKTNDSMSSVDLKKIRGQILEYCINNKITNYDNLIGVTLPLIKVVSKENNNLMIEYIK